MNNNDLDVITKQGYYVVKGNELIQKNRYKLSLAEQKTIAYICSMIKPLSSSRVPKIYFSLHINSIYGNIARFVGRIMTMEKIMQMQKKY